MFRRLLILNSLPWHTRIPIKWLIFGLTVLFVCFPYPGRLIDHVKHWRDPNALIEPDAVAIRPLVEELRQQMDEDLPPAEALKLVERFVHEKLEYDWDWNTWGTVDYLPTVTEALQKGKEDCDGRAVVAASLLRNFGFEAQIVTDFSHVWVKTDKGETMGPGKKKAVIATEQGLRVEWNAVSELPRAMAYGVAVFPIVRELIIVIVLWWLLLRRKGGALCGSIALAGFVVGLILLRMGGEAYLRPTLWLQWSGFACLTAGVASLMVWGSYNARRACHAEPADGVESAADCDNM